MFVLIPTWCKVLNMHCWEEWGLFHVSSCDSVHCCAFYLVYCFPPSFIYSHLSIPFIPLIFKQTNKQTMTRKDTNPSLHRMLSSTRSMHRHAVREQRKHRITEHSITNRTERNRRVLERRIAQTHILLAHVKSPHRRQLPQHQRASPVLLQFRHHHFNALD